jgi:ABC-2 type transport system ATP-binding protein
VIKSLSFVQKATYDGKILEIYNAGGSNNLGRTLDILQKHNVSFGRVYSEPPTLNDVFLELTGTELRD